MPHSEPSKAARSKAQHWLGGAAFLLLAKVVTNTVVGTVLTSALAPQADAATTRTGEQVIVEAHEVIEDDLIVWGTYVRIDGIIQGDLVAIANDVVIEGVVEGDLLAGGKTVYLNGTVNDDARMVGYVIALGEETRVADDVFVLGYSLETRPGSRIDGTTYAAVRQGLFAGQIAESLALRAGGLALEGIVAGDVIANVGGLEGVINASIVVDPSIEIPDVPDGVSLAPTAQVGGDLDYRAEEAARIAPGAAIVGKTRHEPFTRRVIDAARGDAEIEEPTPFGDALESFALLLLLGLTVVAVAPRWAYERGEAIAESPMGAAGIGFVAFALTGVASFGIAIVGLLAVVSLAAGGGGFALGLTLAAFFLQAALSAPFLVALLYVAPILASLGIGGALLGRRAPGAEHAPPGFRSGASRLLLGGAIYTGLCAIPTLGLLATLAGAFAGLGALGRWLREATGGGPRPTTTQLEPRPTADFDEGIGDNGSGRSPVE